MSADAVSGPFCTALGCRSGADLLVRVDGRERHLCADCAADVGVSVDA